MRVVLARHAFDAGKYADMEHHLSRLEKDHPESPWLPPAAHLRLLACRKTSGSLVLLQRTDEALKRFPADASFQESVSRFVPESLAACGQSDLETFLTGPPDGPLYPEAQLALARLFHKNGQDEDALKILRKLVTLFPSSKAAPAAFDMLGDLSRGVPTNPRAIGVLLPLDGKYSRYGNSAAQGIRLAAEDMEESGDKFEFFFFDTGEDPDQPLKGMELTLKGMEWLAGEKQVIALLGPLFSSTALVCAAEANSRGVVMLTPSALDTKLTQTGPP